MSIHDEQEIERLRAQAEIRWNEMARMTHEINWYRSDLKRYKGYLRDAIMLLDSAHCKKDDRLNIEIWQNRTKDLLRRIIDNV